MKTRSRPRSPRILRYRPMVVVVSALMFSSGAVLLAESLAKVVAHPTDFNDDVVFRILGVSLSAYFFFAVFLPLIFARIQVFDDRVEEHRGKKVRKLAFTSIAAVETPPAWSRWFWILTKDGKRHRFSVFLERPDYLLDALMAYNPKFMAPRAYENLRLRLLRKDHASARISDRFRGAYRKYAVGTAMIYTAFAVAMLIHLHSGVTEVSPPGAFATNLRAGLFIVGIVLLEAVILVATENLIAGQWRRRFRKNPRDKSRDMAFERRCYRFGIGVTAVLFCSAFVAFVKTDFAYMKKVRAANDAPGLSVSKGEVFALDYRSTCRQCAQKLKVGDLITFVDEHHQYRMARVESLGTRTPAAVDAPPEDVVAIRMNPDGGLRVTIPLSQVLGKMNAAP